MIYFLPDGPVREKAARPTPAPMILMMHNYASLQTPPEWGEVGSWMYWGWDQVADNFDIIDAYLAKANAPVAISIMLIEGIGADSTPYAKIGLTGGWTEGAYKYPKWNDGIWDNAYRALVTRLGAKYDKNPLVHSVWICTGLYGEAIFEKGDWKAGQHNPGRFVTNAIDWYVSAFPTKPLFFISAVTQLGWSQYAASKGVGVKINALGADLPTHWRPRDGSGSVGIMHSVMDAVPTGFEHAFPNTSSQCYHAMLVGLANKMSVLDLPKAYLQTMADAKVWTGESLLSWTRRMMNSDISFWYGRETQYPCPAGAYDCGWAGPFVLSAECNDGCVNLHTTRVLPANLRTGYGELGAGILSGTARFGVTGHVTAIVAGDITIWGMGSKRTVGSDWEVLSLDAAGSISIEGNGYVHLILVEGVMTETPTPYSTNTPIPLITPTAIKATETWTPMPTVTVTPRPKPTYEYIDVLKQLEDLTKRVEKLEKWAQSYEGDGR
jgi:hypothetical protein